MNTRERAKAYRARLRKAQQARLRKESSEIIEALGCGKPAWAARKIVLTFEEAHDLIERLS